MIRIDWFSIPQLEQGGRREERVEKGGGEGKKIVNKNLELS